MGIAHSPRKEPLEDNWGGIISTIELDARQFTPEALWGLDTFSHLEVVYFFNLAPKAKVENTARHPRNRMVWPKVGIFAQRGKKPRNRLAVSGCWIVKVKPQRDLRRS